MFKKEDWHDKITFLTEITLETLGNELTVFYKTYCKWWYSLYIGSYGVGEGKPDFVDPKKVETGLSRAKVWIEAVPMSTILNKAAE